MYPARVIRAVKFLFILLVLLSAFCAGMHTVSDHDMGWHLSIGRYMVQHRQIPYGDVMTFTSAGKPWTYPPFPGLIFYLVYSALGYAGLSWFCALACMGIVAYLVRRGDLGSSVLAMLAVQAIALRTGLRADLFSTVCFAILFGELWSYQRGMRTQLWLLPVVMFLWVNLHPGFIAGLGAIVAYLLIEISDLLFAERRRSVLLRLQRIWPWLTASGAATLVNPWGPEIYRAALTLSGLIPPGAGKLNSSSMLLEYQPIPISTHLLTRLIDLRHIDNGLTWLLLIAAVLGGLFLWKRQVGAAAVTMLALYGGLSRARYEALFAITIVTLGGAFLSELIAGDSTRQAKGASPRLPARTDPAALLATLALCCIAILHIADYVSNYTYVVFRPYECFGAGLSSSLPTGAVSFIRREHLPGNIFEDFELGSYAAWSLGPEYPAFTDTRGGPNNPELIVEQNRLYSESPDSQLWQAEAERWNLNVLLLSTYMYRGSPAMAPRAFCQSATWRPIYMDEVSLVFIRDTQENRPWINRLQIDCLSHPLTPPASASRLSLHDYYLNSAAVFFELNRDKEAEEGLRKAFSLYPEDPYAHVLLGGVFQRHRRYSDAEQEFRISAALKENDVSLSALGRLYFDEGRKVDAVRAFERAAVMSANSFETYMILGRLHLSLNHAEEALAAYENAEKKSPFRDGGESLSPEVYAQIAEGRSEAHRLLGHWAEAITFQQEAIHRTPSVAQRWNKLVYLYEASGQMKLAAEIKAYLDHPIPPSSDGSARQ